DPQSLAEQAAAALLSGDSAARSLDLRLLGVKPGGSKMCMTVRADMLNGHRTCHGGLIFSLADTAFAVACNSHNDNTVAAA
ncbi:hotdog fold thioesterase, partial [Acinetobacter baumannii]